MVREQRKQTFVALCALLVEVVGDGLAAALGSLLGAYSHPRRRRPMAKVTATPVECPWACDGRGLGVDGAGVRGRCLALRLYGSAGARGGDSEER